MNLKRILCPIDFSVYNEAANAYASTLAASTGAEMIYLHSWLPDVYETPPAFFDSEKEIKRVTAKMKEFIKPTFGKVEASWEVAIGSASDQIVEYAKENNIDLIVIGTHGRTGVKRFVMGSVAEAVVRKAECPVLAIKSQYKVPQEV